MNRISGDFNRGYTKAIQDIIKNFEIVWFDFRIHKKKLSEKLFLEFLKVCLEERSKLREDFYMDGFIRFNWRNSEFEYYGSNE